MRHSKGRAERDDTSYVTWQVPMSRRSSMYRAVLRAMAEAAEEGNPIEQAPASAMRTLSPACAKWRRKHFDTFQEPRSRRARFAAAEWPKDDE